MREPINNIKPILNLTLIAPVLEVLSIAVKLMVSLYIKYWLNLVVNTLIAFISIIIPYYLLKLYQEVFLEVVEYIKRKINLLGTTFISIYWVIKLLNFLTINNIKYLAYSVSSLRLNIKV